MDSNDLPLNVSREILQESRIVSSSSKLIFVIICSLSSFYIASFLFHLFHGLFEGTYYEETFGTEGL